MHSVAHELQNPLQTILGNLHLLRQVSAKDHTTQQTVREVEESIHRCCAVLDHAMEVCNYQTRKTTQLPIFERVNVASLLKMWKHKVAFFTNSAVKLEIASDIPDGVHLNAVHTVQVSSTVMSSICSLISMRICIHFIFFFFGFGIIHLE